MSRVDAAQAPRRGQRRRIHWRDVGANWLGFTILTLGALPAIWIVLTAFRPNLEVNASPPIWIPRQLTLEAFDSLFGLNPDIAAGVPPCKADPCPVYQPMGRARYVVEMGAGQAGREKVARGAVLDFKLP